MMKLPLEWTIWERTQAAEILVRCPYKMSEQEGLQMVFFSTTSSDKISKTSYLLFECHPSNKYDTNQI